MMKKKNPILLFLFFENKVIQLAQLTRKKRKKKNPRVVNVIDSLSFEILF